MLIAVLFAGQHTSSITSTWTGLFLMADKSWYKKCCDEQVAVRSKNGEELNYEVLAQMDTLHLCIKEALRLHPPLIMLMRLAHEDFSVTDKDGRTFTVPKGDIVATSPTFSHRLEHVWTDPNTYNPARHLPNSGDGQKPFSFVGFGGGRHGCMGETFAYMQIKTIWSVLLRKYDFDIVSPFPEPDYDSMVVRVARQRAGLAGLALLAWSDALPFARWGPSRPALCDTRSGRCKQIVHSLHSHHALAHSSIVRRRALPSAAAATAADAAATLAAAASAAAAAAAASVRCATEFALA